MSRKTLGPLEWAAEQFGAVELGDRRLNRRVVTVAAAMAADPAGSIPKQSKACWARAKGAYRLFDHERATFETLSQPHWQQTRRQCDGDGDDGGGDGGVVLLIQDTTWLDYRSHPNTSGLGWHGRSKGRPRGGHGLFLHGVLAVEPQQQQADGGASSSGRVLGLAWGTLWARTAAESVGGDQRQRSRRRRSDDRESLRWSKAVTEIGSPTPTLAASPIAAATAAATPAPARRWLHVGDRESDIFKLYRQTQAMTGVGFVVRVYRQRSASPGHDTPDTQTRDQRRGTDLIDLCRTMPAFPQQQQQQQLWVGPRGNRPGRWAEVSVAGGAVTIWSPQLDRTGHALRCWAVRVWEASPPADCQAVEWILLTSEPVRDLADALRVAGYYGLRWLVEEYHNCLKSGCQVEQRQLESAARLGPLIAMLCAVAVRLLQLKNDARLTPDRPASACVPAELVQTLSALIEADPKANANAQSNAQAKVTSKVTSKATPAELTVRQFMHAVAKLGGFLGRKGDGEPGWRTLWRGWLELTLIHAGYELARKEGKRSG